MVGVYPGVPQIFFSFQAEMSSDSSSDSSSSSSSSSSDSDSSSSASLLNYSTRKFEFSKAKSTGLSQWVVTGISEEKIKKCREIYKPTLKRKADLLVNPSLDESIYLRLKQSKNSNAAKANIDPAEKAFKKLSFKVLDLVKPLLFLASRSKLKRKSKSDTVAIKIALRLWAALFRDITKTRRLNILSQVYPEFIGLLDRTDIWSGGEDLFGRKFLKHLVEEAKSQATLEEISRKSKKGEPKDQPAAVQQKKTSNHSNFSSRDGYVTVSPYSFGGRISRYIDAWQDITRDPWILHTVQHGLTLDFLSQPTQLKIPINALMNNEQTKICDEEIASLIEKGAIVQVCDYEFVSGFFLVPKSSGGWRPIINLKALNLFLPHRHFKMEGVNTLRHIIRQGDWLAKVDLKDAYFSVALNPAQRKFFCFKWRGKIFQYVSMPFGLGPAPRIFTKILKPIISSLRKQGLRLVAYLDDILIIGNSRLAALQAVREVINLFESLGFLIQQEKSVTDPAQSLEYIGLVINTVTMSFSLPEKKREKLLGQCSKAYTSKTVSLKELASLLGILNWASQSVEYAPAHFRSLQATYTRQSKLASGVLSTQLTLPPEAKEDLLWWIKKAEFAKGRHISAGCPTIFICSDASLSGWGAVSDSIKTGGPWTSIDAKRHINELELLAAFNGLKCFASAVSNSTVEINIDNTTAVSYINKIGAAKPNALCTVALEISSWCEERDIELHAVYLPGKFNSIADAESRRPLTTGDWMLSTSAFEKIQRIWGMKVDLFASSWNRQLKIFVSWFPQPEAVATDAFTLNWKYIQSYAFPPFNLIPQCLSKLIRDQATTVLITPLWPTQPWFPILLELAVDVPRMFYPDPDLLTSPLGECHQLTANLSVRLIAWRLSGVVSIAKAFRQKLRSSSFQPQERIRTLHTSRRGMVGIVGAIRGTSIPCLVV